MTNLEDSYGLSEEAHLDIKWWCNYLRIWNGKSLLSIQMGHVYQVFTDASGLGMGGVCNGSWFSVPWLPQYRNKHINILELFGVATAIVTWFQNHNNVKILIYTDNKTIVDIWYTGSTKCRDMMAIIRYLFFFLAKRDLKVTLQHVYGYNNKAADLLSRLQVHQFKERTPGADEKMSTVPPEIWALCKH